MTRSTRRLALAAGLALPLVAVLACTVGQKKSAVLGATSDAGRRRDLFEATLRALDEKPEYVDEFFRLALHHRPTLERFIENTAATLDEKPLAGMTAAALVRHPAGLREILVQTLDAAKDAGARRAIAKAIAERPKEAARAMAERPDTIEQATRATVDAIAARPEVQGAFLSAMRARQDAVARLITAEPDLAVGLARAFLRASAGESASGLREKLRALLGAGDEGDGGTPAARGRAGGRRTGR
jgi:hypothetical protein